MKLPENLYPVPLKRGTIRGIDLVESSKSGNEKVVTVPPGYNGIHLIGKGEGQTFVEGPFNSIVAPSKVGILRISDMTVREGKSTAVFTGTDAHNAPERRAMELWIDSCELGTGQQGRWVLFTNQTDVVLMGVHGKGWENGEHWHYPHQFGRRGLHWEDVKVDGAFNEIAKSTARPRRQFYKYPAKAPVKHADTDGYWPVSDSPKDGPTLNYERCELRGFGSAGFGGGGIVAQGVGGHVRVRNCVIVQARVSSNRQGGAAMFDDSGVEHFGRDPEDPDKWAGGEPPAIQSVELETSLFVCEPGPDGMTPMARVGSLRLMNLQVVLERLRIAACGFYGKNRLVSISQCPDVMIQGCNSPRIKFEAESRGLGYATSHDARLHIYGRGLMPISADFVGNTMLP